MGIGQDTPDSIRSLIGRAEAARGRFGSTYDVRDLDEAVDAWDVLLAHPVLPHLPVLVRSQLLSNGGSLHQLRYLVTRVPDDLESALRCWQGALDPLERAVDDGEAEPAQLPILLASIAGALEERYARGGSADDLMAALSMWDRTVRESAPDSPYLGGYLFSLGILLHERYQRQPRREALDDTIAVWERAVESTLDDSAELPERLDHLAAALGERYVRFATVEDLDLALELYDAAIERTPDDAPTLARILNNFSRLLHQRFVRSGSLEDSQRCIDALKDALGRVPVRAPFHTTILKNLKVALDARYVVTGFNDPGSWHDPDADLERAVEVAQQVVAETPPESPDLPWRWFDLANTLLLRYLDTHEAGDLDAAIAAFDGGASRWVLDSPHLPRFLTAYALALRLRFELTGGAEDLRKAIKTYALAMIRAAETAPGQAVAVALLWGAWAGRRHAWKEAAWAYGDGLKAMTRLFQTQMQRYSKERWLALAREIVAEAAYAEAQLGQLTGAVEALEVGRALLLSEAVELNRARLDGLAARGRADLEARYEAAAQRWNQLSNELDAMALIDDN